MRSSLPPQRTICSVGSGGVCAALLLLPVKLLAGPRLAGAPVGEGAGSRVPGKARREGETGARKDVYIFYLSFSPSHEIYHKEMLSGNFSPLKSI